MNSSDEIFPITVDNIYEDKKENVITYNTTVVNFSLQNNGNSSTAKSESPKIGDAIKKIYALFLLSGTVMIIFKTYKKIIFN